LCIFNVGPAQKDTSFTLGTFGLGFLLLLAS
jgi:hypothetical protein